MRKLFLVVDDLQVRHDRFNQILTGHDIVNAFTVTEAIASVSDQMRERPIIVDGRFAGFAPDRFFDVIFLDHDIDSGVDRRDVVEFVKWIVNDLSLCDKLKKNGTKFFIHSHNPVGARSMQNLLENVGFEVDVVPFH